MGDRVSNEQVNTIRGAFWHADWDLFRLFLDETEKHFPGGDLLEVGVAWGRSAVLVGGSRRRSETFTVIDLFGDSAPSTANSDENDQSYPELSEEVFAANYLSVHDELPTILRGPSDTMMDALPDNAFRFIHVDGGHLYEQVRGDLLATRSLLGPRGVVVADDWRTIHAPGVSAALWNLVADHGLVPICVSSMKFYATWGDATPYFDALDAWLIGRVPEDFTVAHDTVHGKPIVMLTDGPALAERCEERPITARQWWSHEIRRRWQGLSQRHRP